MELIKKVELAKKKTIDWFKKVEYKQEGFGVYRCSEFHDTDIFKGELLHGTYDALNCLYLLGQLNDLTTDQKNNIDRFINSFQLENGVYRNPDMKPHQVFKTMDKDYTWEYIDFHVTNYCMGALSNLAIKPKYKFSFIDKYNSTKSINEWLQKRNMSDAWLEGNNFVNLASFFIEKSKDIIDIIIKWHEDNQDPATGYWGTNLEKNPSSILYGMAGAAHNYHIYTYFDLPIKYHENIIDYCIEFANKGLTSACLDVDVIDILCNMIGFGYRVFDIKNTLEQKVIELLDFQNEDGGFCDLREGIRRQDGWVAGYFEPQGLSNTFATWFRWVTIAMSMCCLFEEQKDLWNFRNTIGIGYYNKQYNFKMGAIYETKLN